MIQCAQQDGEGVTCRMLPHEHIQMPVAAQHMQAVIVGPLAIEPVEALLLTLPVKTVVLLTGDKHKARIGSGRPRQQIGRDARQMLTAGQ